MVSSIFDDDTIEKWSKIDPGIPSAYNGLFMFVPVKGGRIGITNIGALYFIYTNDYSQNYSSFSAFLSKALNQHIVFDPKYLQNGAGIIVLLSSEVKEVYEKNGIKGIASRFCEKEHDEYVIYGGSLNSEQLYSVLYYFFLNGYAVTHDDHMGAYYAKPTKVK